MSCGGSTHENANAGAISDSVKTVNSAVQERLARDLDATITAPVPAHNTYEQHIHSLQQTLASEREVVAGLSAEIERAALAAGASPDDIHDALDRALGEAEAGYSRLHWSSGDDLPEDEEAEIAGTFEDLGIPDDQAEDFKDRLMSAVSSVRGTEMVIENVKGREVARQRHVAQGVVLGELTAVAEERIVSAASAPAVGTGVISESERAAAAKRASARREQLRTEGVTGARYARGDIYEGDYGPLVEGGPWVGFPLSEADRLAESLDRAGLPHQQGRLLGQKAYSDILHEKTEHARKNLGRDLTYNDHYTLEVMAVREMETRVMDLYTGSLTNDELDTTTQRLTTQRANVERDYGQRVAQMKAQDFNPDYIAEEERDARIHLHEIDTVLNPLLEEKKRRSQS